MQLTKQRVRTSTGLMFQVNPCDEKCVAEATLTEFWFQIEQLRPELLEVKKAQVHCKIDSVIRKEKIRATNTSSSPFPGPKTQPLSLISSWKSNLTLSIVSYYFKVAPDSNASMFQNWNIPVLLTLAHLSRPRANGRIAQTTVIESWVNQDVLNSLNLR